MKTSTSPHSDHPVAIIGAGPIGLVAAAHLLAHGVESLILEARSTVAANIRDWGHVRLFTPWKYLTDAVSRRFLQETGWISPDPESLPSGEEFVQFFVEPLAGHPALAPNLHWDRRVIGVSRKTQSMTKSMPLGEAPFELRARTPTGAIVRYHARAVLDASGTYDTPNSLGSNGRPIGGEWDFGDQIYHGLPDVLGRHQDRYGGRRTLVVGSGHSAFHTVIDLAELRRHVPQTEVVWAVRRESLRALFGSDGRSEILPARQTLAERARDAVLSAKVRLITGFQAERLNQAGERILVTDTEGRMIDPVDQVIVNTGFRPNFEMLREIRLDLDPTLEAPVRLAPLVDPAIHDCGSVEPHGYEELRHPEENFFIVGIKSYGRSPTFLLRTGYAQVRSVAAALAGDLSAARAVRATSPAADSCTPKAAGVSCCGVAAQSTPASACAPRADADVRRKTAEHSNSIAQQSCCG